MLKTAFCDFRVWLILVCLCIFWKIVTSCWMKWLVQCPVLLCRSCMPASQSNAHGQLTEVGDRPGVVSSSGGSKYFCSTGISSDRVNTEIKSLVTRRFWRCRVRPHSFNSLQFFFCRRKCVANTINDNEQDPGRKRTPRKMSWWRLQDDFRKKDCSKQAHGQESRQSNTQEDRKPSKQHQRKVRLV